MSGLLLLAATALPFQDPGDSRGDRLVKVELLADHAAIRPGEAFSLGVRLRVEPGWHVYWENHGDSGFPTSAKLAAPPGFTLGAVRFPGPERHVEEGDIVTYVHEGEVLLVVDGRAPERFPAGLEAAAFSVDARWLVCQEVCYPGSGRAELAVPIAAASAKPALANEKAFAEARGRLPKPWSELAGAAIEWRGTADEPVAVFTVPGASELEIFPLASDSTFLAGRTLARTGTDCRLTAELRYEPDEAADGPRMAGVLRVRTGSGATDYRFDSTPKGPTR